MLHVNSTENIERNKKAKDKAFSPAFIPRMKFSL